MFIEINSKQLGRELIAVDRPVFRMIRQLVEYFENKGYSMSGWIESENKKLVGEYFGQSSSDELTIAIV